MFDEIVVNSIEQAKELPAVKRVYQNEFVRSKIRQFEKFLDRIIRRNVKKAVAPTKKKLTLLNWILINGVVFAYFAGKADAQSIDHLEYVFMNYSIIGTWGLAANIGALILLGLSKILRIAARIALNVFAVLLAAFFIYWVIKKLWEFFTEETELEEEITPTQ
jgi:hypothetical protein